MVLGNLIFQTEVVEQRFTAVVLPHHDQQASDDRNQTEHGRMLSSNMLLRNLILLIDVTFSTPTGDFAQNGIVGEIAIFRQQLAHHFHGLSTRALNLQSSSWGHILVKGVWHSLAGNLHDTPPARLGEREWQTW